MIPNLSSINRLFSSINSASLPLNTTGKLKIYSALPNGFRLTNGFKHERGGLAIIGANHFNWNFDGNCWEESIKTVLRVLRPVPEIVVLGGGTFKKEKMSISEEFGCAVEAAENKMTAAETFNTLIDDNRQVIGFFKLWKCDGDYIWSDLDIMDDIMRSWCNGWYYASY